nr:MAG TPA: hypothetical protein [Caudoviricetes sp.]
MCVLLVMMVPIETSIQNSRLIICLPNGSVIHTQ